jgi:hypothetical protein
MKMAKKTRPALTDEERAEKARLRDLIERHAPAWQAAHPGQGKLTQTKLGELVAQHRGDEVGQGAIWQYISTSSDTKLNADIVQVLAAIVGFEAAEVSPRFAPKAYALAATSSRAAEIMAQASRLPEDQQEWFLAMLRAAVEKAEEAGR